MRLVGRLSAVCYAQQRPIRYTHGAHNAASYAPFWLPNAAIARGSIFTIFGENLGPAESPAFPLSTTLAGVSVSVTQSGTVTQCFSDLRVRQPGECP